MRDELMKDNRTRKKMKWKETLHASPAFYTINGAKNESSAEDLRLTGVNPATAFTVQAGAMNAYEP